MGRKKTIKKIIKDILPRIKIGRFFLVLSLIFLLFYIVLNIKIRNIICENQFQSCSKSIFEKINSQRHKNIFSTKRQIGSVLKKDYLVESFFMKYVPPSTIRIKIIEREAEYSIKDEESEKIFLIDKNGIVLNEAIETSLPMMIVKDRDFQQGENIGKEMVFCLDILSSMTGYVDVAGSRFLDDRFTVELEGGTKLLFPLEGNQKLVNAKAFYVLTKTNLILDSGKNLGFGKIDEIDFRFKNPIIRYI